jgi:hypothetical protein
MTAGRFPALLLRVEGFAVLAGSLVVYFDLEYGVLALLLLFLAPDISLLGYLAGPRVGAIAYNAVHTYAGPLVLAVIGVLGDADVPVQVALIWSTHIGIDRLLGFGLKYPTTWRDTHLQRV